MADQQQVEEISAKIAGQEINLKSLHMNTLLTGIGALFAGVCAVGLYFHIQHEDSANLAFIGALKEQTTAIKEQTQVGREQNCLMRFDTKDRQQNSEFCKQVTR